MATDPVSGTRRQRAAGAARSALALAVGAGGGAAFALLHLPLAWMLGAMVASAGAALSRLPMRDPGPLRPLMTAVIGTALGGSVGPGLFAHAVGWLVPLAGLMAFLVVAGGLTYAYFRRVAGLDPVTAYFAAMPGGLVEMVTLGAERGGDERMIALVHGARIFLVVLVLPFLIELLPVAHLPEVVRIPEPLSVLYGEGGLWFAGALLSGLGLGKVLRLPAPHLLGPLLASAVVHLSGLSDFRLPEVLVVAAQVVIGTAVGCRFLGVAPRRIVAVLATSLGSTALLLTLTVLFAAAVAWLGDGPLLPLVLAYSPGGVAEMSLVALSLGIDTAFVIVHHVARVLLVIAGSVAAFSVFRRGKADG